MKIGELVEKSPRAPVAMESRCSVHEAIEKLQNSNARALIVTENDRPIGIFAERDVLRTYLHQQSVAFNQMLLKDVMTPKLISATPEDDVASSMNMMLKADIHHLPVIDKDSITAMLTLYDLVQQRVVALENEVHALKDYIADLHDAGMD
jgi:CBS domain-containing protein